MLRKEVGEEGLEQSFQVSTGASRQINVNKNNGSRETDVAESRHAPCHRSNVAVNNTSVDADERRNAALEEAALVAESYEPQCESCPRGGADAIRHLKTTVAP